MLKLGSFIFIFLLSQVCFGSDEYKGYFVHDEEMTGFYPCGGGDALGIDLNSDIDVWSIYQNQKTYLREPIYIEATAVLSSEGLFGYGLVPEPVEKYLQISEIKKIENHAAVGCGAVVSGSIIDVQIVAP